MCQKRNTLFALKIELDWLVDYLVLFVYMLPISCLFDSPLIRSWLLRFINVHFSIVPFTVPPEIRARGPEALEAYNNALAEGQACVKRVPLMIVGQDRSGKTSLKKSLKGICFNPDEDSTLGIEVDLYDFKVTTEIWKTGGKDEKANIDTTVISYSTVDGR